MNVDKQKSTYSAIRSQKKAESYRVLCRRLRAALTEAIIFLEEGEGEDGDGDKKRSRLFGDKETALGAMTKTVALLGKLIDVEQAIKTSSAKPKGSGQEEGFIEKEDIALLQRFLERCE